MMKFIRGMGAIALALIVSPCAAQLSGSEVVRVVDRGATKSLSLAQVQGQQIAPSGFKWDFAAHPLSVYRSPNGRYFTDLEPRSIASIAPIFSRANQTSGATLVTYVDAARTDNSGDGLTPASAEQGIRSALADCEAATTAQYCLVYVKAGDYDRTRDFNGTGGQPTAFITKPSALVCYGGPCTLSPAQKGLAWTADGAAWVTTRAATARVLNEIATDAFGDRNEFVTQADAAAVKACVAQDCININGATVTIKRADGAQPSDANTRVLLASDVLNLGPAPVSFYMSGFTVLGGVTATFQDNTGGLRTKDVVIQDTYFGYPAGVGRNAVQLGDINGFVGFWRVTANKGTADGFNARFQVTGGATDWLLVDPVSYDDGRAGSLSNNCLTSHDGGLNDVRVRIIALNGACRSTAGASIRPIGGSQMWLAGFVVDTDLGDTQFGGLVASTCMMADDYAMIWAQDVRCSRTLNSMSVTSTASISIRRVDGGGGLRAGSGNVLTF